MEVSDPCHVLMRKGVECDLYLVTTKEPCFNGIKITDYLFKTEAEAELYVPYLRQKYGVMSIKSKIHSDRLATWEKREYVEFLKTIDTSELENAVKDIKMTVETKIIKRYQQ